MLEMIEWVVDVGADVFVVGLLVYGVEDVVV